MIFKVVCQGWDEAQSQGHLSRMGKAPSLALAATLATEVVQGGIKYIQLVENFQDHFLEIIHWYSRKCTLK